MPRISALTLIFFVALVSACGYRFSSRWEGKGGADKVEVEPFENYSTEPSLGVVLSDALTTALARRGASGPGAKLVGFVRERPPGPSSANAATFRVAIEVTARLMVSGKVAAQASFSKEADYLSGADPVETEGRRALALRHLAEAIAPEILATFER